MEDREKASERHEPDEIVTKLRQIEVLRGQGAAKADIVRETGMSEPTFLPLAQGMKRK